MGEACELFQWFVKFLIIQPEATEVTGLNQSNPPHWSGLHSSPSNPPCPRFLFFSFHFFFFFPFFFVLFVRFKFGSIGLLIYLNGKHRAGLQRRRKPRQLSAWLDLAIGGRAKSALIRPHAPSPTPLRVTLRLWPDLGHFIIDENRMEPIWKLFTHAFARVIRIMLIYLLSFNRSRSNAYSIFRSCYDSYDYEDDEGLCHQEEKATFETINQNSFSLNGLKKLIN